MRFVGDSKTRQMNFRKKGAAQAEGEEIVTF